MSTIVLNNVLVCSVPQGTAGKYVPNTGKISSVSDRVDLRRNSEVLKGGAECIELDAPGIDGQDAGKVVPGRS